jgi:tRNA1(Val) A37 N6-methylase TrmN6
LRLGTAHRLVAKRLQLVHPMRDRPARLALVELRRAQDGGLCVEPPIVEWVEPGRRSPELTDLVDGLPVEGSAGDRTESRPPPEH